MKFTTRVVLVLTPLVLPLTALANPGPGHHPPPPEAIEACQDLFEDDTCTITLPDGEEVDGMCMAGPREELPLACRPEGPPPERSWDN